MRAEPNKPILELLSSHWLSLLGAALVTTAGFSWLFVLPMQVRGHASNPYIGLMVFIAIPVVFCLGLALIPIGIYLGRSRGREGLGTVLDRAASIRRVVVFLAVTTAANIVIATQGTYRAVEHMETVQFCGQSCHVMLPEFTSHENAPHARVTCVECHVAPGATGWVRSKMAGVRQLRDVTFNTFPRPIASGLESNRLVPASQTCEACHWPGKINATRLRIIPGYKDDEANTATQTVLMMPVNAIHGAHFGPGIEIHYAAADAKRQTIPWVEYRNRNTNQSETYLAQDTKPEQIARLTKYQMQCVDCHNRPTHAFKLPERALNESLASMAIPNTLPYIKKASVEILKTEYSSTAEAGEKIPAALRKYYQQNYPEVDARRTADVARAASAIVAIYNRNVFPDLKVTWGTYPDNLGHTDFPGCFRCHDEAHATSDKKTITQDCGACHNALAVDEGSPDVLKTLGLAKQ